MIELRWFGLELQYRSDNEQDGSTHWQPVPFTQSGSPYNITEIVERLKGRLRNVMDESVVPGSRLETALYHLEIEIGIAIRIIHALNAGQKGKPNG